MNWIKEMITSPRGAVSSKRVIGSVTYIALTVTVRLQQEEDDTSLIFNGITFEEADIKPIDPLFFAQL